MPKIQNTNGPKAKKASRKTKPIDWKRVADDLVKEHDRVKFDTGAVRCAQVAGDSDGFPLRYDLLLDNTVAIKRLARTYGEGSLRYPPRNWMKGMPESSLLNHAIAHLIMHREGDISEDHLAHACWNLCTLMYMQEVKPELLDVTGPLAPNLNEGVAK